MFELFFAKYKEEFHKGSLRNLTTTEQIVLAILLLCSVAIIAEVFLKMNQIAILLTFFVIIIDTIVMFIYENRKERQQIDARTRNYKSNTIERLEDLLKNSTYNLYNEDGITWLISCCEENMKSPKPSSLGSVIFPVFTLAYGVVLKDMTVNDILVTTSVIVILIVIFNILNRYIFAYIFEEIENHDKFLYRCLKSELEYIKIQFLNTRQSSITQP